MAQSSFYSDTPNYAEDIPAQNDGNTNPVAGNTTAPSSFYQGGANYSTVITGPAPGDPSGPSQAPSSFYGTEANYAADYPTQNDGNTNPVEGNTPAPSSFYQNGQNYNEANAASAYAFVTQAQAAAAAALASQNAAHISELNSANNVALKAGTATPLMDGTAAVGTSDNWAHEDHRHPTDTSRASVTYVDAQDAALSAAKADKTYVDTQDAALAASVAGAVRHDISQSLGGSAQTQARTNINAQIAGSYQAALGYTPVNKAGDTMSGALTVTGNITATDYYVATNRLVGTSGVNSYNILYTGSSAPSIYMGGSGDPANYYRNTIHYFQNLSGSVGYMTLTSAVAAIPGALHVGNTGSSNTAGDIHSVRPSSPTTGVLWLGNTGARYLHYDGSSYNLPGAHLNTVAGRVLGTSTDAGLLQNVRMAYVNDVDYRSLSGTQEPYGGAVCTGLSNQLVRYRYLQAQNYAGTWYTVGYV